MTVEELAEAYQEWARGYYRCPVTGKQTSTVANIREAVNYLLASTQPDGGPMGELDAAKVSAKVLYNVQQQLAAPGTLARQTINERVNILKRMFCWAASPIQELIPEEVGVKVRMVPTLRRGRSRAKDLPPVTSVPLEQVQQTCLFAPDKLRVMIGVQWATGMRSSELCGMRKSSIDTTRDLWVYEPRAHKTAYKGQRRIIPLGPKAQEALSPWMGNVKGDIIFPGTKGRPMCRNSYRLAIRTINAEHGLPQWTPHQVRHAYATRLEREAGIDAAQIMLDHQSPTTTTIYCDPDTQRKIELAQRYG